MGMVEQITVCMNTTMRNTNQYSFSDLKCSMSSKRYVQPLMLPLYDAFRTENVCVHSKAIITSNLMLQKLSVATPARLTNPVCNTYVMH